MTTSNDHGRESTPASPPQLATSGAGRWRRSTLTAIGLMTAVAAGLIAGNSISSLGASPSAAPPPMAPRNVEVTPTDTGADTSGELTVEAHRAAINRLAACMTEAGHSLTQVGPDLSGLITRYAVEATGDDEQLAEVEAAYEQCYDTEAVAVDAAYQAAIAERQAAYYQTLNTCLASGGLVLPEPLDQDSLLFPSPQLATELANPSSILAACRSTIDA